jgi:hypothetical protein
MNEQQDQPFSVTSWFSSNGISNGTVSTTTTSSTSYPGDYTIYSGPAFHNAMEEALDDIIKENPIKEEKVTPIKKPKYNLLNLITLDDK